METVLRTMRLFMRNVAYRWHERPTQDDQWMTPVEARRLLLAPEKAAPIVNSQRLTLGQLPTPNR